NLGDLATARHAFALARAITSRLDDPQNHARVLYNLTEVALLAGELPTARESGATALAEAGRAHDDAMRVNGHAVPAAVHEAAGEVAGAQGHLTAAIGLQGSPIYSLPGLPEVGLRRGRPDALGGQQRTEANRRFAQRRGQSRDVALCDILLGHMRLADD